MENITVNILGCAIVFFFGFYAGIIYRRKDTKENFKPSHNSQRDEIPTFEIMWQRMSKDCPRPSSLIDAVAADSVRMGAVLMYDALIKIKVDTSPV